MELKGKILGQFKVGEHHQMGTWVIPKRAKRQSLVVLGMSRENFPISHGRWKNLEFHCDNSQCSWQSAVSRSDSSKPPELSFNRLQLTDEECSGLQRRNFGRFIAREAVLDEEYWVDSSMVASRSSLGIFIIYEEFYALKRRCTGQDGNSLKCFCFVAVKKEEKNIRRSVLNSVVGTLDLSIRQFLLGETYPGEIKRPSAILASHKPYDTHKYAYVANVCVAKFARRKGIALNMLYLATDVASLAGMKQLFVHVNADNLPAQELYKKTGFKIVEAASSPLSKDQMLLMNMEL
ncbi:GCN5-related N-acetyltransferase 6, chloroplastic-like isoform X2 [Actinidia eriantha]|uniref:GCN5-related N-acetyltransferase 6, chloroplastic-like isoform X2 n=1 Tax=Actinidia eriantha TaxID=165200 RepID=UPI0025836696|nr:GCN5-related N-acetyltransferase 6, chloroplastic-like isoform X2 [Actinidia eriantha]